MNDRGKWFNIFGDGAPWIQATLNTILGVMFAIGIVVFVVKLITTSIQAKMAEDDETKKAIRRSNVRNIFALGALLAISVVVFTLVNILPEPAKPNTNNFFKVFGGAQADAQKYFNLVIILLISLALIIYLVTTPMKLIKYMSADDEGKADLRKHIISSTWWMGAIVLALFIVNVVLNVVPAPSSI